MSAGHRLDSLPGLHRLVLRPSMPLLHARSPTPAADTAATAVAPAPDTAKPAATAAPAINDAQIAHIAVTANADRQHRRRSSRSRRDLEGGEGFRYRRW